MYHDPVLLSEAIEGLNIDPSGVYVDVTFGGGGHSKTILEKLGDSGRLIAFDQDEDAVKNQFNDERFQLVEANFRFLKNYLRMHGALPVDGVLADLGVSSHQFDTGERGFSTRFDGPLDMRMDQSVKKTAAQIVAEYDEEALERIFKFYGELRKAKLIARELVSVRETESIDSVEKLKSAVERFGPKNKMAQFFAQVFQALRIEVNDELKALEELLVQSVDVLEEGGRLVVISYHSLEDRLVKNFLKTGNFSGKPEKDFYGNLIRPLKPVKNKVTVPTEEEIKRNPRARSAKMRVAIKNG
ncbi:MAG: 16S rRNA (cytosine(1402)-N(4))-methyltransferase RsmH [Salibacter sp.]|uniref:16S rRNA (cytosine(1402)-N(4))-methyltransferase RsmH n=1 Tax=Salibacter sp. TaxID=2010995 RepID=UPI0028707A53|nr:16S rRNA (cytosine(1402)-N(4))-methyltransferase RsmH [Salibacter sp.]MDR9398343.1 16S rRNA (cytosine(1402)-N(4))-methyltransferase RsmH [Salibacter sp.]